MKLYVGNLPWSIDDKALKDLFSSYGDIEEAVLIKDKFSGRSKGFGFITFTDDDAGEKAIKEMHEKDVDGRPLTVSEARPMVPRDNAPRGRDNEEPSEAPMADPSAINQSAEENGNEEIETAEEAKEDASSDEPATEEAIEAKEETEAEIEKEVEETVEAEEDKAEEEVEEEAKEDAEEEKAKEKKEAKSE